MDKGRMNKAATEEIRKKIKLLNSLVVLIILSLLLVIVISLYSPLQNLVLSLPYVSIAVILASGMVIGLVGLYLSRALARQVVQSMEEYHGRLDRILNITREIKEEVHDDIILDKMIRCSLAITHSEAGSILLLEDNKLVYKSAQGIEGCNLVGRAVPVNASTAGQVLSSGESFFTNDPGRDARLTAGAEGFNGYKVRSLLLVPLRTKQTTLGVMEVCNKREGLYDERDLDVARYLADQTAIAIENARFHDDQKNFEIHLTDILLETMDSFLPEKKGHAKRVAQYANVIAKAMEMPEEKRRRLHFAALLHDIGFLRIDPERRFDKAVYVEHTMLGYEMLHPIDLYRDIALTVLHHHERYDGDGYPKKLRGEAVPLESRIIAVADAFDAMVSEVTYQVPVNLETAVAELKHNAGGQFDPSLVPLFTANIESSLD